MASSTPTGTKTFIVRLRGAQCVLGELKNGRAEHRCVSPPSRGFPIAKRFTTLADAVTHRATRYVLNGYDVLEVTWGLRWYSSGVPRNEYANTTAGFAVSKKETARHPSPQAARASSCSKYVLFGAEGPNDKTGWKVVRFLKKVA